MRIFVGAILCIAAVGSAWTISQYRARKATEAANADNPVYGTEDTAALANQQLADAGMTEDADGKLGLEGVTLDTDYLAQMLESAAAEQQANQSKLVEINCTKNADGSLSYTVNGDNLAATYDAVADAEKRIASCVSHSLDVEHMRLDRIIKQIPLLFSTVRTKEEMHLQRANISICSAVTSTIKATRTVWPKRFLRPLAAHSSICSAITEEGVMG